MKFGNIKVNKMSTKLGLGLSKFYFPKGCLVEINITKGFKQKVFLTKYNKVIVIRKDIIKFLDLKYLDLINLEIVKINNVKRTNELFINNKIDMLSLIPERTSRGYEIFVTKFEKNNQDYLRIWYSHERGSGRQIEIRRFMNIESIGSLLGQYQAEGTKHKKTNAKFRVEFGNKLVEEHREFMNVLLKLGVPRDMFKFYFGFNPNKISKKQVEKYVNQFKFVINYPVKLIANNSSKGIGFRLVVRNTLLTEIVINGLDKIRKLLVEKNDYTANRQNLGNCFFAKLLTGDGTLDVNSKRKNFPRVKVKIVDGDYNYLRDYYKIMGNLGFKPKIYPKYINVVSACSFKNLLYLYQIKAFSNTNNWNKLLVSIMLCLRGRRINTYYRFLDLIAYDLFNCKHIVTKYSVSYQAAREWLINKCKEGLIVKVNKSDWALSDEGKYISNLLMRWKKDYTNLINEKRIEDPTELLESLKFKKLKYNSKQTT
jgi:hypothetical protein